MTHSSEIWDVLQAKMLRRRWVSLDEIYQIVEQYGNLDDEDFGQQSPSSAIPKWKRNVRNVLQYRKSKDEIQWDRSARYLLS